MSKERFLQTNDPYELLGEGVFTTGRFGKEAIVILGKYDPESRSYDGAETLYGRLGTFTPTDGKEIKGVVATIQHTWLELFREGERQDESKKFVLYHRDYSKLAAFTRGEIDEREQAANVPELEVESDDPKSKGAPKFENKPPEGENLSPTLTEREKRKQAKRERQEQEG